MSALTITTSSTALFACTVDLTKTASVSRSGNNPVIIIPIPTGPAASEFAGAVGINLKMMSQRIDIKFTLTTGVGTHNYTSPSTDYEKLWYMFTQDEGNKILLWEGFSFPVQMDTLVTPTEGGNYNLMQNCSMGLVIINP